MAKSGHDGHDGQQHVFFIYSNEEWKKIKNPKKIIKYPQNPKKIIKSQKAQEQFFKISLEIVFFCVWPMVVKMATMAWMTNIYIFFCEMRRKI